MAKHAKPWTGTFHIADGMNASGSHRSANSRHAWFFTDWKYIV